MKMATDAFIGRWAVGGGTTTVFESIFSALGINQPLLIERLAIFNPHDGVPGLSWIGSKSGGVSLRQPAGTSLWEWQERLYVIMNGDDEITTSEVDIRLDEVARVTVTRNFTTIRLERLLEFIRSADKQILPEAA